MGGLRFALFRFGLAVAALMAMLGGIAHAQTGQDSNPLPHMAPSIPSRPSEAGSGHQKPGDVDDDEAAPDIPPPIPGNDPSQDPEEKSQLEPDPNAGDAVATGDGDGGQFDEPRAASEGANASEGVTDVPETLLPEDGTNLTVTNSRVDGDPAGFDNPPAPPDPLLYQIEDLDPVRDNRTPRRLFRQEPYDPIGIKLGSWVLFPEIEIGTSWYSNVFLAPFPT